MMRYRVDGHLDGLAIDSERSERTVMLTPADRLGLGI